MRIQVKSLQGDQYIVEVQSEQTTHDVKVAISEQANNLPVTRQKLVYKGRTMQDSHSIGEYNLEEGCKVHLILRKEVANCSTSAFFDSRASIPSDSPNSSTSRPYGNTNQPTTTTAAAASNTTTKGNIPQSRLEVILRERLAKHFTPSAVEKIMVNLQNEINADANSSSFDDLERLAKQKLNISNE